MRGRAAIVSLVLSGPLFAQSVVEQPRPFGYVVGDLLTQRVLLSHSDLKELPPPRRVGVWFERRASRIESTADGRRWLRVEYQLINAPEALTTVNLPAWDLESTHVPAWPVSIGPLTPRSESSELRADRTAPVIATTGIRSRLILWSMAFISVLAAWLAWLLWRNRLASSNQPFARALIEMRAEGQPRERSWLALHRAFDLTAHRAVQGETLPALFERAPQLLPLQREIEQFFAESRERFFGSGLERGALDIRALCLQLRQIEKRYER
jgi:mxaA protein